MQRKLGERARDLAAYLAASHHGKVRIGIRSLPGQRKGFTDSNPDTDYLLGYRLSTLETIPAVELDEGLRIGKTTLDLSLARNSGSLKTGSSIPGWKEVWTFWTGLAHSGLPTWRLSCAPRICAPAKKNRRTDFELVLRS